MFAIAAYAVALAVTLVLARYCTPRAWWRRANARALGVLAAGTLVIGTALLWVGQPAAMAN
ncbi:MAG TPA: SH3 domain-containing protein, partial [Telluria sp.]|nr:SH3 domain-containing protein [Telluria sp.]